jgi:hypothetical protein
MIIRLTAFALMLLSVSRCHSQWAASVLEYAFGTNQTLGQSSAYFPANVLGPVTVGASATAPAFLPQDVVSLGRNGYVALAFDRPIVDGDGPDFIVFENAFLWGENQVFGEWMTVSVSEDGIGWVAFPYDTLSGAGMAGRSPTLSATTWADPLVCGGDGFDLATVGLAQVRYVRVQDATRYQPADHLSAELDAVVAIHQLSTAAPQQPHSTITCHLQGNQLTIGADVAGRFVMFSADGRILAMASVSPGQQQAFAVPGGLLIWQFVPGFVPGEGRGRTSGKVWIPE